METGFARFLGVAACLLALLPVAASASGLRPVFRPGGHPEWMSHGHGGHRNGPQGYASVTVPDDPVLSRSYLTLEPQVETVYVPVPYLVSSFAPVQRSTGYYRPYPRSLALPAGPKMFDVDAPRRTVHATVDPYPVADGYRPRWRSWPRAASARIYSLR